MSEQTQRQRRLSEMLRHVLMPILQHKLRNPELSQVTVTDIKISPDMAYAKVYFSLLDPQHDYDHAMKIEKILTRLKGYMRYQVAQNSKLRKIPELQFHYDTQIAKGQHLEELIETAMTMTQEVSEQTS